MKTMPASIASATRTACSESVVNTYEPSSNEVSFARAMASSSEVTENDHRHRAEELFAEREARSDKKQPASQSAQRRGYNHSAPGAAQQDG